MPIQDKIAAALDAGRNKADEILQRRALARQRRHEALQANPKRMSLKLQLRADAPLLSLETAGFDFHGDAELQTRINMMVTIIDQFNAMLQSLVAFPDFAHVHYLDLRRTLSNQIANYKESWANEIHPTEDGFEAVTKKFAAKLAALP